MKKYLVLICLLLGGVFVYAQHDEEALKLKKEKEKIVEVLDKYIVANETQNIKLIEDIWYISEDIEVFGTAAGERLKGWDDIKKAFIRQFNTFTDTYISGRDRNIHIDDSCKIAWVSQMITYNFLLEGVQRKYEGVRFTAVLRNFDGRWKIVQMHLSLPH
jgi:ketosteroid isomerase-like protein